jgi:dephospho-CoA kinase
MKPVIALIGGVASGKSAVARTLEKRGALVVDADAEGHAVLLEPEVIHEVSRYFGPDVLDSTGQVDRKKLAARAFADAANLAILNAITHPRIRQRTNAKIEAGLNNPGVKAIVLDISLLLESGAYEGKYSLLLFVDTSEDSRFKRVAARGWAKDELQLRQARQLNLEEKRTLAHVVIDNNGTLADLDRQVEDIWQTYVENRPPGAT